MAQQTDEEMRAPVSGTAAITVEEYQAIAEAAQADPQLMARIDQALQEAAPQAP
jgi:hypothetical protein